MSDNIILSILLLFSSYLSGASKLAARRSFITPHLIVFREGQELSQARDKIRAAHLNLDRRVVGRRPYFFEIRYNDEFTCPHLLISEFIQGRQHVFISHHLGMADDFRGVSIYKDDIEGEYYMLIFAKQRPMETNL